MEYNIIPILIAILLALILLWGIVATVYVVALVIYRYIKHKRIWKERKDRKHG